MSNQKTVLITGGAGFIGSHVAKALFKEGYTPVVYDNLQHGHAEFVKWGPLVQGDLNDPLKLMATLQTYAPIGVIHMAALTDLRVSMQDPASYYRVNLAGSLTLLEAMEKCGIRFCIFSSTAAIFGIPEKMPIDETSTENPISPYGRSKWMVEQILKDFEMAYGLRFASLRYFNAAGADPDGELGENHSPPSHLIPIVIDKVLSKKEPLSVFGTDHPTKDGSAVRDYIHVSDLADAHVKALQYIISNDTSLFLNLGSGNGHSVFEVIQEVETVAQLPVPLSLQKAKAGDPHILICNNTQAKEILNWTPQYSSLAQMVQTSFAWQQKQC
ncbi:MAG: UDP-glucose 4-epimerase GalE [Simkaniaceae bacterium]|nr:UDP-glucose 4-epimerase GalE [Simkaniaceae bacterium]